jgi:hypothetical protein
LFSLSGDVLRPGLHELPFGTTLRELVMLHGGGMLGGRRFKAVFTGGPSNTMLTEADFDVAMDFDSLRADDCGHCNGRCSASHYGEALAAGECHAGHGLSPLVVVMGGLMRISPSGLSW